MPTYSRPTGDFVTSTLSGAITAGDTSATIGTGLTLPAANGVLQVDYDSTTAVGLDNGPETISYTAYNTSTGAISGLTRELAGTTGVAHANAAKVSCSASALYYAADQIPLTELQDEAWTSWTPTLSGRFTDADWTKACKYQKVGRKITAKFQLKSTDATPMAGGSGDAIFTLPATATTLDATTNLQVIGMCNLYDANGTVYPAEVVLTSTTTATIRCFDAGIAILGFAYITSTVPFTWTTNDEIGGTFTYESAA